ncbi:MAG: signal recognition particle receptor subunit alpha, partial [Arenicellales bacterium]
MSDLGEKRGLFARLKKTRASLTGALSGLFEKDGIRFDDQVFDELEDQLIMADLGVSASATVVDSIRQRARKKSFRTLEELKQALADEIGSLLEVSQKEIMPGTHTARPFVLMMVGVNG